MKLSKFIKVDKDILIEYIYDDNNLISEPYSILVNIKDNINSFISSETSVSNNTINNQLFLIDPFKNKYGKVDVNYYSFLKLKNYGAGIPIEYDTIKIHLPINYTFGEYIGCYLKVYTYGYDNKSIFELSNFYIDITDVSHLKLINYTSPPLLFQEKLWGKNIQIQIPSVNKLSSQRINGRAKENTINSNLTNGIGLSITSPIFIDFHFILKSQVLNGIKTYFLSPKTITTIPQTPEFKQLGLKIEPSSEGDFFEIYGTYNGSITELKEFIENSIELGNRYYIQYSITLYEQNIRGKTLTIVVNDNFDEKIEYRPIIKYSTTTAVIDVEMKLINAVDNSYITRRASYGMLPDELSKYSLNLSKINIRNAIKPKIYNTRNLEINKFNDISKISNFGNNITLQTIKLPFPVMIERYNIITKSDSAVYNKDKFYGMGKLLIYIYPFDNIINFIIASNTVDSSDDTATSINYLDMSSMNDIKLEFKNSSTEVKIPLYREAENNLSMGHIVFKIPKNKIPDIRRIYESNNNIFYITTTNNDITTVIYSGLFKMYDSVDNINELNQNIPSINSSLIKPRIIQDTSAIKEKAIVTRKIITKTSNIPKNLNINKPTININKPNININRKNEENQ